MAKSEQRASARSASVAHQPWWIWPGIAAGCVAGIVLAYLHVHFGGAEFARAGGVAVANIAIFLASYSISRRITPKQHEGSLTALITSAMVALPVFIIAFFGLGYEIAEMADFAAMYILGVWIGSAEAAEVYKDS